MNHLMVALRWEHLMPLDHGLVGWWSPRHHHNRHWWHDIGSDPARKSHRKGNMEVDFRRDLWFSQWFHNRAFRDFRVYPKKIMLLMVQKSQTATERMYKIPNVNNGISYQPQLVTAGFLNHQQYWEVRNVELGKSLRSSLKYPNSTFHLILGF